MEGTLHHLLAVWMQFVLDWGYLGVFVMMFFESTAVPIPAEVVIPPAAYWAAQGRFNVALIVVAATAGSWAGSASSYWVATKLGRPLVERYGRFVLLSKKKIEGADRWFDAYGAGGIFVARLLPGIRHLISIPAGLFKMNFRTFSVMTIVGAGVFNGALAWFGIKVLGDQPALMKDPAALRHALESKSYWLIGFALVIGALYALMIWMQKRAEKISA
ncbi:MAG TPA: DedA family protein [Thermoanaerobaculia bacterium]|nr:DedA family protein [Thermoanaerobaculia bacterium]